MRITDDHLATWERDGFVVVDGFLTPEELEAARANFARYYPSWDEFAANRPRYRHITENGFSGQTEFPFEDFMLNDINTHPDVISFAERALGTNEIHCNSGLIWAKYAGAADFDQPLHVDFHNNTLVYPRDDGMWRHIPMILYLTDVTPDHGPTHIVPRTHTDKPDDYCDPNMRPRGEFPELYEHEVPVTCTAGSLLIYTMKTYHRGSAMRATEAARFTHHFVYRHAGDEWMGWRAWPRHGNEPAMRAWIQHATPRQREVIGFPGPGHPYWTAETLEGVARRYPDMDMVPYREAAQHPATAV